MWVYVVVLELLYVVAGLVIAFIATMGGIGGGVFMVPLFYYAGLSIEKAVATSKFVIMFSSAMGTASYARLKRIPYRLGIPMLAGMVPASFIGAYLTARLDPSILKFLIGLFVTYYGVRLIATYIKKRINHLGEDDGVPSIPPYKGFIIGVFSGLIAGITGTGGGAINMPLFIGVLKIPIHVAVALSIFLIFPSAVAAVYQHVSAGMVVYDIGVPFAIGSLIGAIIGPRMANRLKPQPLRLVIAFILIYIGARMLSSIF